MANIISRDDAFNLIESYKAGRGRGPRGNDITGQTYGKAAVLAYIGTDRYVCTCSCGNIFHTRGCQLRRGDTTSCGCFHALDTGRRFRVHGGSGTSLYRTWFNMNRRCYDKGDKFYHCYGARGITVCEAWQRPNGFGQFQKDMGQRPFPHAQLDRIDNDGPYCKTNCRWATKQQQDSNRRSNVVIKFRGKNQALFIWCRELNLKYHVVYERLKKLNWSVERSLTTPT